MDHQHISDGWQMWLAEQIGMIRGSLMSLERRMDRQEDRMDRMLNGKSLRRWTTGIIRSWRVLLLIMLTALILTGHITLSEVKPIIIKKLQEF